MWVTAAEGTTRWIFHNKLLRAKRTSWQSHVNPTSSSVSALIKSDLAAFAAEGKFEMLTDLSELDRQAVILAAHRRLRSRLVQFVSTSLIEQLLRNAGWTYLLLAEDHHEVEYTIIEPAKKVDQLGHVIRHFIVAIRLELGVPHDDRPIRADIVKPPDTLLGAAVTS